MASLTRSSARRAEGPRRHHHGLGHGHSHHHHHPPPLAPPPPPPPPPSLREKRGLEALGLDVDALRSKKARLAVGLLACAPAPAGGARRLPPRRHGPLADSVGGARAPPPQTARPPPSPEAPPARKPGRKLRSQEATRFKSELAAYFPDYDEVIGNEPKEQHLLNLDTPIVVVDSNPRRGGPPHPPPVRGYADAVYADVLDAQRIDFGFLETQHSGKSVDDPLPDGLYKLAHKKAERLERSIRNSEKGRAQHERDQIVRLLEGLQGHDWLRVMGVSGVTETRKRTFEPARAHFVRGCQAILDKFRDWSREEKRRKLEKERALAADDGNDQQGRREAEDASTTSSSHDDASEASSPAQQLRREAMARSQMATAAKRPRRPGRPPPPKPPERPRAFASFFRKRHERDGAVHRTRRTGRKVLAWGHAVPDMAQADFVLPEEFRDDTLRSRARKKRRDRRGRRP